MIDDIFMIKEFDLIVLNHDVEDAGLKTGDVGTIVHCYSDGEGFEVEFVTADGRTIAVLTLNASDIRGFEDSEILHSREIA